MKPRAHRVSLERRALAGRLATRQPLRIAQRAAQVLIAPRQTSAAIRLVFGH
eukprot:CAMPEP_0181169170 /NCGR_PEP_ID=MMETSP1096-20121128/669_1 /TAXON_ID=156174 ORGANISM="Chrysochromulina ericina, Strain CCMP281" /NCGR_SAMPLE_ID=MMETSP1096 /ASSEMBLY_ACC=CAM_ASM_000453 /LENGTH=51 /DNA_ID=CAMNT_0023256605 /DNA_START=146 /DNA_END=301 /DNA_ORIENTATION=+